MLLLDKNHQTPAAAQASSNVVRCTLAAITVAFLGDMLRAMGIGWILAFLGAMCIFAPGLLLLDYHSGTAWRQKSLKSSKE